MRSEQKELDVLLMIKPNDLREDRKWRIVHNNVRRLILVILVIATWDKWSNEVALLYPIPFCHVICYGVVYDWRCVAIVRGLFCVEFVYKLLVFFIVLRELTTCHALLKVSLHLLEFLLFVLFRVQFIVNLQEIKIKTGEVHRRQIHVEDAFVPF